MDTRETFWVFMVHNNASFMLDVKDIWTSEIDNILTAEGILPALVFQPISTVMTSHFTQNGGNALGITAADGPLTRVSLLTPSAAVRILTFCPVINTSIKWTNSTYDARVLAAAKNFIDRLVALAKQRGLAHRYIYQNYATIQQDVFSGYGQANKARLAAIHKKYDPNNVFTKTAARIP